jgi:hypothetical protein
LAEEEAETTAAAASKAEKKRKAEAAKATKEAARREAAEIEAAAAAAAVQANKNLKEAAATAAAVAAAKRQKNEEDVRKLEEAHAAARSKAQANALRNFEVAAKAKADEEARVAAAEEARVLKETSVKRVFEARLEIFRRLRGAWEAKSPSPFPVCVNGSAALRMYASTLLGTPLPYGDKVPDVDSFFMTYKDAPVEPHIVSVTLALEQILQGFSEEELGSVTAAPQGESQKCIEVQYRTRFDLAQPPLYRPCWKVLTDGLVLREAVSHQVGVSRWNRDINLPFNILLNFETEGRVRLAIRGHTPDGTLTLLDGQTVPTFPQIVDITFYFIPTAPVTVRQHNYFRRFEPMIALDDVMYAGLPMVLCQQVEFIHNSKSPSGELPEKIVNRLGLCIALFNKLNPGDQRIVGELLLSSEYADAFRMLLAQGTPGGSARKTRRRRQRSRRDTKGLTRRRRNRSTRGRKRI